MDQETEKIIKEQINKAPREIRDILANPETAFKIFQIGKKNDILDNKKLEALQLETNLVLLGLVYLDEFETELKINLGIDTEKTKSIANEINETIFKNIREQLIGLYDQDEGLENETLIEGTKQEKTEFPPKKEEGEEGKEKTFSYKMPPEESEVLRSTGIEIMPEEIESPHLEKLTQTFQTPIKKTEYTLEENKKEKIIQPVKSVIKNPIEKPTEKYEADPYREPIE